MNQRFVVLGLSLLAACSSAAPLLRLPSVPLLDTTVSPVEELLQGSSRAAADRSPPLPYTEPRFVEAQPVDRATVYRTVTHVVEVPVPQPVPAPTYVNWAPYEPGGYAPGRYREYREPWFPVNTAIGAGIGAIIGNQSGDSGEGALIGGAYGLLLDLGRWR